MSAAFAVAVAVTRPLETATFTRASVEANVEVFRLRTVMVSVVAALVTVAVAVLVPVPVRLVISMPEPAVTCPTATEVPDAVPSSVMCRAVTVAVAMLVPVPVRWVQTMLPAQTNRVSWLSDAGIRVSVPRHAGAPAVGVGVHDSGPDRRTRSPPRAVTVSPFGYSVMVGWCWLCKSCCLSPSSSGGSELTLSLSVP
jgi:hypothetical protein